MQACTFCSGSLPHATRSVPSRPSICSSGHGEGLHGSAATNGLRDALADARKGLPRIALRVPALALDAPAAAPRMVEPCRQPASAAGRSSRGGAGGAPRRVPAG